MNTGKLVLKNDEEASKIHGFHHDPLVLEEGVTRFSFLTASHMLALKTTKVSSTVRELHFLLPYQQHVILSKKNPYFTKDREGVIKDQKGRILAVEGNQHHLEEVLSRHPEYQNQFLDAVVLNDVHSRIGKRNRKKKILYLGEKVETLEYDSLTHFRFFFVSEKNPNFEFRSFGPGTEQFDALYDKKNQSLLHVRTFPDEVPVCVKRLNHHVFSSALGKHDYSSFFSLFPDLEIIEKGNVFQGYADVSSVYTEDTFRKASSHISSYLPLIIPKRIRHFDSECRFINMPLIINESECFKGVRYLTPESISWIEKKDFEISSYYESLANLLEEKILFVVDSLLGLDKGENYLNEFLTLLPFRHRILKEIEDHLCQEHFDNTDIHFLLILKMQQQEKNDSLSLNDIEDEVESLYYYRKIGNRFYPLYFKNGVTFSLPTLYQSDENIDYRYLSLANKPSNVSLLKADSLSLPLLMSKEGFSEHSSCHLAKLEFSDVFHVYSLSEIEEIFDGDFRKNFFLMFTHLYVTDEFYKKRNGQITTKDLYHLLEEKPFRKQIKLLHEEKKDRYDIDNCNDILCVDLEMVNKKEMLILQRQSRSGLISAEMNSLFLGSRFHGDGVTYPDGRINLNRWSFDEFDPI